MSRLYLSENRNLPNTNLNKKTSNKKGFSTYKKNTINSVNEIEYFLRNFTTLKKSIKLYKILKFRH